MTTKNTPEKFEDFLGMDREGMSASVIAARLGVSERTVGRWRALAGRSRPVEPSPVSVRERAREMLEDGASRADVAETLGVNSKTVWSWFPQYAWTAAQRSEYRVMVKKLESLA